MPNKVEVSGERELKEAFNKIANSVDAKELSMAGAEVIFEISQKHVPVDTGELRDSGEVIQVGDDAEVIYNADHAMYIEFGTSKMPAQPYLRPAIDNKSAIIKAVTEKLSGKLPK